MKILFIGSNPSGEGSLTFERDITALQIRALGSRGLGAEFIFMPSCPLEDLPQHLTNIVPDIIHFSAHGGDGNLTLSDVSGRSCQVDATMIKSFVDPDQPPRLIYLSACNAKKIASDLQVLGLASVAATAPITNQAARSSALCFYDRVLRGFSVRDAHTAAHGLLRSLNTIKVNSDLYEPQTATGLRIGEAILFRVPRIIAEPIGRFARSSLMIRPGLMDFPRRSSRIFFFTADRSFYAETVPNWGIFNADTDDFSGRVCWSDPWSVAGDFTIMAVAASSDEMTFSGCSTIFSALNVCNKYRPRGCEASARNIERTMEMFDNHSSCVW